MNLRLLFVLLAAFASVVMAQPPVASVAVNAATNILPGLPNAPIAQGGLFIVYGARMGPPGLVKASYPLPTNLSGTSIKITVRGTTTNAILVYTLASQVAAILPSSTPEGVGQLTVSYNGQSGAPIPVQVVASNIGVFALNQAGSGDGIVTFADYSVLTPNHAGKAGDVVIIWATGLGPVSFDETQPPASRDMTEIPLEVWMGGKPATVLYRGRNACCAALDQINIQIPAGIYGCVTPLTLKIGSMVSNTTTLALGRVSPSNPGRNCTPSNPQVSEADFQKLYTKGQFSAGGISLTRSANVTLPVTIPGFGGVGGSTTKSDTGTATFFKTSSTPTAALNNLIDVSTYGSCTVNSFSGTSANPLAGVTLTNMDAGASVGVSGPNGAKSLAKQGAGGSISYTATLGAGTSGNWLDAGAYTITGPGGAGVGSFSAAVAVPSPLVWTNQGASANVDRVAGHTVTWTGGDFEGYVTITGTSVVALSGTSSVGATFTCTAQTGDGTFTIPPQVLLALPASATSGGSPVPGSLTVTGYSKLTPFAATGLDFATASFQESSSQKVVYQ